MFGRVCEPAAVAAALFLFLGRGVRGIMIFPEKREWERNCVSFDARNNYCV